MKRLAMSFSKAINKNLASIIKVEGLRVIKESFEKEGFIDIGGKRWEARKTKDKRGRDITRYKTSRVGTKGTANAYGRKIKNRQILTGHNSGSNKLRNSYRASHEGHNIVFFTHKKYAEAHNKGLGNMPKRQHAGPSRILFDRIDKKFNKQVIKAFKGQ